jgi:hypothetical protein
MVLMTTWLVSGVVLIVFNYHAGAPAVMFILLAVMFGAATASGAALLFTQRTLRPIITAATTRSNRVRDFAGTVGSYADVQAGQRRLRRLGMNPSGSPESQTTRGAQGPYPSLKEFFGCDAVRANDQTMFVAKAFPIDRLGVAEGRGGLQAAGAMGLKRCVSHIGYLDSKRCARPVLY